MRGKLNRKQERALSHQRLCELLRYDPKTGEFIWIKKSNKHTAVGSRAGCVVRVKHSEHLSYVRIAIDYALFSAHRLAWFYMTKRWPDEEIDHIDLNGLNNRWDNLREAPHLGNSYNQRRRKNNTSGVKGVAIAKDSRFNKFRVTLGDKFIGDYPTLDEAKMARELAARKLHGAFYRAA